MTDDHKADHEELQLLHNFYFYEYDFTRYEELEDRRAELQQAREARK